MSVSYQLTEGERWKRTLRIEVSLERVRIKFEETYRKIKAEAQVPGFRPGKVPLSTIKSRFGDLAKKDVFEELMEESYGEAVKQAGLDPINYPKISEVDFEEDKPLVYIAELEIRPVITLERYTGLSLKRPDDRLKDGEVQKYLEYLKRKHASLETVERSAVHGDFVLADLTVVSDSGGQVADKVFADVQLELIDGNVASQFLKQLTGVTADTQREIEIAYPEDHSDTRFAGATVKFAVKVKAVKQINLPELNEEFFKQFDETITTIEQFTEKLSEDLQVKKKKDADDFLRNEVIKEVIDKNRFELPDSLIERFLDAIVEDMRKGERKDVDEQVVRETNRAFAIRHLRWDLLKDAIAEKENIKAEPADIDNWLQRFADNYKMSLEEAREAVTRSRKIAGIKETLLEHKVIEFITSASTIETILSPMLEPDNE